MAIGASEGAGAVAEGAREDETPLDIDPRYRRTRLVLGNLALAVSDAAVFAIVYLLLRRSNLEAYLVFYRFQEKTTITIPTGIDFFALFALVAILYFQLTGHYGRTHSYWVDVRSIVRACIFLCIADLGLFYSAGLPGNKLLLGASWATVVALLSAGRYVAKKTLIVAGLWQLTTVIVGTGHTARRAFAGLRREALLGYDVRLFLDLGDVEDIRIAGQMEVGGERLPIALAPVHSTTAFRALGRPHVIVALDQGELEKARLFMDDLSLALYDVDVAVPIRELPSSGMDARFLFGQEICLIRSCKTLLRWFPRFVKRLFDVIVSSALLIVLSPLLAFICLRILWEDGRPVFFSQERVGFADRRFPMHKFRTMLHDAETVLARWEEENPSLWQEYVSSNFKLRDDPRITRAGQWLRPTSFDELPQLWNVLKGDMSLVGPRPLLAREIPDYGPSFHFYTHVHPGITGLWQVSGRSETRFPDRAFYDEWYIRNWSLWHDVVILLKTVPVVVLRQGAY